MSDKAIILAVIVITFGFATGWATYVEYPCFLVPCLWASDAQHRLGEIVMSLIVLIILVILLFGGFSGYGGGYGYGYGHSGMGILGVVLIVVLILVLLGRF